MLTTESDPGCTRVSHLCDPMVGNGVRARLKTFHCFKEIPGPSRPLHGRLESEWAAATLCELLWGGRVTSNEGPCRVLFPTCSKQRMQCPRGFLAWKPCEFLTEPRRWWKR